MALFRSTAIVRRLVICMTIDHPAFAGKSIGGVRNERKELGDRH